MHHNITTCKSVDKYAEIALDKIQKIPYYVCSSYEKRALMEVKRREQRKAKTPKAKSKPRCSYCKAHGHKRPKCDKLLAFKKKVYSANKRWKKLLVKRVNEVGLGIGCLVKLDAQTVKNLEFNVEGNHIAMITEYNINNLNVFCALGDHNRRYQSNTTVKILSGDRTDDVSVKYLGYLLGYDLFHVGWWYQSAIPEVLTPMPWEPDEEWIEDEWNEILNWFFHDINESDLIDSGIIEFIDRWSA